MENIQEILDNINRVYQQGINSKIDRDLLLDYTRKFYELISVVEPAHSTIQENDTMTIHPQPANDDEDEVNDATINESTPDTDLENDFSKEEVAAEVSEGQPTNNDYEEPEADEDEEPEEVVIADEKDVIDEIPAETTTEELPISDEAQLEESLLQQQRNISFEPPHPAEDSPLFLADGIEEDQAEDNVLPPQSIPVDNPKPLSKEEEPVVTDYAKIFNFSTVAPNRTITADIRKKIGINDKYLFLNELFNSDKSAYEKALDHINTISQYPNAVDWVKDNPAVNYKWHDDDDTVLDFYEVLRKHFNDR